MFPFSLILHVLKMDLEDPDSYKDEIIPDRLLEYSCNDSKLSDSDSNYTEKNETLTNEKTSSYLDGIEKQVKRI